MIKQQSEALSSYYDQQTIKGPIARIVSESYPEVVDGSYVLLDYADGCRECRKVSVDTVLGKSLIGLKKGETVEVEITNVKKIITIIDIKTKYYYQHYLHFKEIMDNGGNQFFTPIKIDTSEPSSLLQQLESAIGKDYLEVEKQNRISDYQNGRLPLIMMVNEDDIVGCYYGFLFSKFKLVLQPYSVCLSRKEDCFKGEHTFILDFTSLLLLFEFCSLHEEVRLTEKFILPLYHFEQIKSYRKVMHVLASFHLYEAFKDGHLHHYADNLSEDMDMRFDALLQWIESNCIVKTDENILRVSVPDDNNRSRLLSNTYIALVGEDNANNVLITDDTNIEMTFKAMMPIVTTETYVYQKLGKSIGEKFSIFLCENHCVGANLSSNYIYDQFFKLEAKEPNTFQTILDIGALMYDVNEVLNTSQFILRDAHNMQLAESMIDALVTNQFRRAKPEMFQSEAWVGMLENISRTGIGRRYIRPVLKRIANDHKTES